MKKSLCILFVLLLVSMTCFALTACDTELVDYAAETKLDLGSSTKKMSVTVKNYVDGDTTHFNASNAEKHNFKEGVLKARYLAVDTPESTGDIEPYGKQAAEFTKNALKSVDKSDADAIILESNDSIWNADTTGDRHLVWVWYRKTAASPYRLLNLELLQAGLAKRKNVNETLLYYDSCNKAVNQAQNKQLKMFSNEDDPLYCYGAAKELSLKQLRVNIAENNLEKVAFEGIVANHDFDARSLYVVDYDVEDDITYGVYIFYGYNIKSGFENFVEGTRIKFVGTVSQYETTGQYQVSSITYDPFFRRDDAYKVISTGNEVPYNDVSLQTYLGKKSIVVKEDEPAQEFDYAELTLQSLVKISGLTVNEVYTTSGDKASAGAMTLTCTNSSGTKFTVRTDVLHQDDDAKKPLMVESDYLNKTINVLGFGDYYNGAYQLKALLAKNIEVL